MFATDTYVGISGGDWLPNIPGNRFRIFYSPGGSRIRNLDRGNPEGFRGLLLFDHDN